MIFQNVISTTAKVWGLDGVEAGRKVRNRVRRVSDNEVAGEGKVLLPAVARKVANWWTVRNGGIGKGGGATGEWK